MGPGMLVAYIFVHTWPDLAKFTKWQKRILLLLCVSYGVLCLVMEEGRTKAVLFSLILLTALILWLLNAGIAWIKKKRLWLFRNCALFGLILSLGFQGFSNTRLPRKLCGRVYGK